MDELDRNFGCIDVGKLLSEQGLPFLAQNKHESCAASRGVHGPKGHDIEGEEWTVRSSETKFGLANVVDCDLVKARFGVCSNPVELACAWSNVVRHGKVVHKGDRIEAKVGRCKGATGSLLHW